MTIGDTQKSSSESYPALTQRIRMKIQSADDRLKECCDAIDELDEKLAKLADEVVTQKLPLTQVGGGA